MLIACQECNNRISDKADRCPRCGADKDTYLGSGVFCSECQKPGHRAYDNCANCGAPSSFLTDAPTRADVSFRRTAVAEPSTPLTYSADGPRIENPYLEKSQRGRSSAGLWARYCAKQIDFAWLIFPAAILAFLLFSFAFPGLVDWNDDNAGPDFLFGFVTMILIACLEAVIISIFGSSPGKWLAGISLRNQQHKKLSVGTSLARSLRVYVQGLGLGIPFIALFTQLSGYNSVKNLGKADWDKALSVDYISHPIGPFRWIILVVLAIAAFVLLAALAAIGSQ